MSKADSRTRGTTGEGSRQVGRRSISRQGADVATDIRPEVLIHRARRDVAEFMFDPANDLAWAGGITASTPNQPGPRGGGDGRTHREIPWAHVQLQL
jgi:hypothetical protein